MVIVDSDPGDEHLDAPAVHFPACAMDLLFAQMCHDDIVSGVVQCSNDVWNDMERRADWMRWCCEHCAAEVDDGQEDGS